MQYQSRKNTNAMVTLAIIAGAALLLWRGYMAITTILLSVKDFHVARGIGGSPFIGLRNFEVLLASPPFASVMRNTVFLSAAIAAVTALLSALAVRGLASIKEEKLRYIGAAVLFLPYVFPYTTVMRGVLAVLSIEVITGSAIVPVQILMQSLFVVPFVTLGALMLFKAKVVSAQRITVFTALGALAAGWYMGCCGAEPISALSNPLNLQWTETLSTYAYRTGILGGNFSNEAIIDIIASVLGKLGLLAFACAAIAYASKREEPNALSPETSGSWAPALPALALSAATLVLVLFIPVVQLSEQAAAMMQPATPSFTNWLATLTNLIAPVPGLLLGALVGVGISQCNRPQKRALIVAFAVILTAAGQFTISGYLAARSAGLINSLMPKFDLNVSVLAALLLTAALAKKIVEKHGQAKLVPRLAIMLAGAGLILYAVKAGGYSTSVIASNDMRLRTISALSINASTVSAFPFGLASVVHALMQAAALAGGTALLWKSVKD